MKNAVSDTYTAAIVITSDRASRGEYADKTAEPLQTLLSNLGYELKSVHIIPDDEVVIVETLQALVAKKIHYIVTSGGTGVSPRDLTPEATRKVISKEIPGVTEMLRAKSLEVTPFATTARGLCGLLEQTVILNCPGSTNGCLEYVQWSHEAIWHILKIITKPDQDPHK